VIFKLSNVFQRTSTNQPSYSLPKAIHETLALNNPYFCIVNQQHVKDRKEYHCPKMLPTIPPPSHYNAPPAQSEYILDIPSLINFLQDKEFVVKICIQIVGFEATTQDSPILCNCQTFG
jgi:hypothetical protein